MLAKKERFQRRKYGGWGVTPKTRQGWVYIGIMILFLFIFHISGDWNDKIRLIITVVWLLILLIDIVPIMFTIDRDEREHKIEAISERNAAWFMVLILVSGILYDLIAGALQNEIRINYFMAGALFGGIIVKSISNYVLERKGE
ncbi:MAG TPA: hypothetical protein VJ892_00555 [Candidatus Absconditabacterales bacterium]|nr:hypothetical protein [Candidatus Absconditabacterales bacterium]